MSFITDKRREECQILIGIPIFHLDYLNSLRTNNRSNMTVSF